MLGNCANKVLGFGLMDQPLPNQLKIGPVLALNHNNGVVVVKANFVRLAMWIGKPQGEGRFFLGEENVMHRNKRKVFSNKENLGVCFFEFDVTRQVSQKNAGNKHRDHPNADRFGGVGKRAQHHQKQHNQAKPRIVLHGVFLNDPKFVFRFGKLITNKT